MSLNSKNPAWVILTEDEKLALNLQLGHQKSTWEVGEILQRAHYKYLEISKRAEQFLKMFTIHYKLYQTLIPNYIKLDKDFRQYLELTMEKRLQIKEAVRQIKNESWLLTSIRERVIIKEMTRLSESDNLIDRNLHELIMNFDRWNNFRILPAILQEPSAFKRRNKNKLRKQLNTFTSFNPFLVDHLIARYEIEEDYNRNLRVIYVPFITEEGTQIIKVRQNEETIEKLSSLCIYMFPREEQAKDYIQLAKNFISTGSRSCKDGLNFWPKYRVIITYAINFDQVQKIIPSRKGLELAHKDLDINLVDSFTRDQYPQKRASI